MSSLASRTDKNSPALWFPLAFMVAVLVLRVCQQHGVLAHWPNFSPLMALAFAGTVLFPRPLPWWSWIAILIGVDLASKGVGYWVEQTHGRFEIVLVYVLYAVAAWWGGRLRGRIGAFGILGGTLACSVLFYLVTNSVSWMVDPRYAKDASGWVQALFTGVPGYPSTLLFFRNSLTADLLGALALILVYNTEAVTRGVQRLSWRPRLQSATA